MSRKRCTLVNERLLVTLQQLFGDILVAVRHVSYSYDGCDNNYQLRSNYISTEDVENDLQESGCVSFEGIVELEFSNGAKVDVSVDDREQLIFEEVRDE